MLRNGGARGGGAVSLLEEIAMGRFPEIGNSYRIRILKLGEVKHMANGSKIAVDLRFYNQSIPPEKLGERACTLWFEEWGAFMDIIEAYAEADATEKQSEAQKAYAVKFNERWPGATRGELVLLHDDTASLWDALNPPPTGPSKPADPVEPREPATGSERGQPGAGEQASSDLSPAAPSLGGGEAGSVPVVPPADPCSHPTYERKIVETLDGGSVSICRVCGERVG
jgi:hypothetical protein